VAGESKSPLGKGHREDAPSCVPNWGETDEDAASWLVLLDEVFHLASKLVLMPRLSSAYWLKSALIRSMESTSRNRPGRTRVRSI